MAARPAPQRSASRAQVVAAKLGVSISGLARAGVTEALTTDEIEAIRAENPDWLEHERATQAEVRRQEAELKKKPRR